MASYFLRPAAPDDGVPVLRHDPQRVFIAAEGARDIDIEARDMPVLVDEIEGRIGAFGGDADGRRRPRRGEIPAIAGSDGRTATMTRSFLIAGGSAAVGSARAAQELAAAF